MKAIEKDRTRRYGSVSDLATDLRRHLDDLPVLASPPSTVYRVSKFVRRHRIGVTTTVVIAALLVAFATTMAVQARRIGRERDRANREAQAAKEIADFLVGLFTVSDPSQARGNTVTAREILDQGAQRIGALSGQPSLQGRLQRTLGGVYTSLGLYALADPLLERALETERRVLGSDNQETMDTLFAVGDLRYYEQRHAEAEAAYREAAQRRRVLLGPDAKDTMEAEMAVASACMQQGRFDEAERLLRSTLERQQRVLGDEDSLTLNTLNELSVLFFRQGRYAEGLPFVERTSQLHAKLFGENAPRTLISQGNLADTLGRLKRYDEAEQLYRVVISGQDRVLGRTHPMTQRTITKFAAMYDTWGKQEKAAEWRAKLPKEPPANSVAR
jgi:tetratricopeptide (TPR) repeat protein